MMGRHTYTSFILSPAHLQSYILFAFHFPFLPSLTPICIEGRIFHSEHFKNSTSLSRLTSGSRFYNMYFVHTLLHPRLYGLKRPSISQCVCFISYSQIITSVVVGFYYIFSIVSSSLIYTLLFPTNKVSLCFDMQANGKLSRRQDVPM